MDSSNFNYFSVKNNFWIQFQPHLISFGFKKLPKDIHFTVSFNSNNPDINLHITKNTNNKLDKPQITIVCIDKKLLDELSNDLIKVFFKNILKPFDIEIIKKKNHNNLGFISFNNLQSLSISKQFEETLINSFKDYYKIKSKRRLKFNSNIEEPLQEFSNTEKIQKSIFESFVEIPEKFSTPISGGIIVSENEIFHALYIKNQWYLINTEIHFPSVLEEMLAPNLLKSIIRKTLRSITYISDAKNYSDTLQFNNPIRLIKQIHSESKMSNDLFDEQT